MTVRATIEIEFEVPDSHDVTFNEYVCVRASLFTKEGGLLADAFDCDTTDIEVGDK